MKRLLSIILLLSVVWVNYSQELSFNKRMSALSTGTYVQVAVGDNEDVTSPGETASYTDTDIKDFVTLGIDHNYPLLVRDTFSLEVDVIITPQEPLASAYTITLEIEYFPFTRGSYQDRDSYLFEDVTEYNYEIDEIRVNGTTETYLPDNVYLDGSISLRRYYDFTSSLDSVTMNNATMDNLDCDYQNINDDIEITWNTVNGAFEYQLEWTFVNNLAATVYADSIVEDTIGASLLDYDFRHNSTRITTTSTNYTIPLLFEQGFLVYRVRSVGEKPSEQGSYIYSKWGVANTGSIQDVIDNYPNHVTLVDAHDKTKNWQVTTTFAEEGKKKEVVSYYDGSLRNRQSVTKVNTDDHVIVGETIYDHQGRPAVNVLPVPVQDDSCSNDTINVIKFYPNFNRAADSTAYSRENFDIDSSSCYTPTGEMSNLYGASRYYSANNPYQDDEQAYVPDAEGYPFTVVEYTPDNTGRIRKQSGVGPDFKLGSGHESRYFYGKPDQIQLDRLFGSEVGYAKHHKKNMVIDPNGQISVSYLDQEGRVIATSLAGEVPTNVDTLASYQNALVTLVDNMIVADEDNLTKYGLVNQVELSQSILVSSDDQYLFTYNLETDNFNDECMAADICFSCIYDLTISLTDDCGNPLVAVGGDTVQFTIMQGHMDTITQDSIVFTTDCNVSNYEYEYEFSVSLEVGNYNLVKTLTINEDAQDFYLEAYLDTANNECLHTYDYFLDGFMADIDTMNCYLDCDLCVAALGLRDDFISEQKGTGAEYDALLDQCLAGCEEPTACEMAYEMMLADLSPGGQYGEYLDNQGVVDVAMYPLSIYNVNNHLPDFDAFWRNPVVTYNGVQNQSHYLNLDGSIAYVQVFEDISGNYSPDIHVNATLVTINGEQYVEPQDLRYVSDFLANWQSSWAEALITYHPEHCYYEECIQYSVEDANGVSSQEFDADLRASSFADALSNGWIEEDALNPGVYILSIADFEDPMLDATYSAYDSYVKTQLNNALTSVYTTIGSTDLDLLEMAALMNNCGVSAIGSTSFASSCLEFGTDSLKRDASWNTFVALYLSKKDALINELYEEAVADAWCVNDCIGNEDFNPYNSNFFDAINPFSNNSSTGYLSSTQPCSIGYWYYYLNKQKRFPDMDQDLVWDADFVNAQVYSVTGQSPLANNMQSLLDEIAAMSNLTSASDSLNQYIFYPGFYLALIDSMNVIPAGTHSFVSSTDSTLEIDFVVDGNTCTFNFETENGSIIDWDSVTGFSGLQAVADLGGGQYSFVVHATETQGTTIASFPLYATTCYDIVTFDIADDCNPTGFGHDIHMLFSVLAGEGNFTGDYSVGTDSDYAPLLTDAINVYLDADASIEYYYTADSVWLTSSIGTAKFRFLTKTFEGSNTMDSVAYFNGLVVDTSNQYTVSGYQADGDLAVTLLVESVYTPVTRKEERLYLGTCGAQPLLTCNTEAFQNLNELGSLMEYIFVNSGNDLLESPAYTYNLAQYFESGTDSLTVQLNGDGHFVVHADDSVSNCDVHVYPASGSFVGMLPLDVHAMIDFRPAGNLYNNAYYGFEADLQLDENGTPGDTITVYGYGCIPIAECLECEDVLCGPDTLINLDSISVVTVPYTNPCVENMLNFAAANADNAYQHYIDSLSNDFVLNYRSHCIDSLSESFIKKYDMQEYHYTLYYYDQAGNLVKTIPPEGVSFVELDSINDPNGTLLDSIASDRLNNEKTVFTDHRLATKYVYNSLNQLVKQNLPDHDAMDVWEYSLAAGLDDNFKVRSIDFINESEGYMAGFTQYDGYNQGRLYRTTNGGENWEEVYGLIGEDVNNIHHHNTDTLLAVGDKGTLLISVNNGTSWNLIELHSSNIRADLYDIYLDASGEGLIVGDSGLIAHSDGVASFDFHNNTFLAVTPTCTTCPSTDFEISTSDKIVNVDHDGSQYIISVQKEYKEKTIGLSYTSTDGTDWKVVDDISVQQLNSLSVIDDNHMKLVGDNGVVLSSNDGGENWYALNSSESGNVTGAMYSDSLTGVSIIGGTLFSTTDGGANWTVLDDSKTYTDLNYIDTAGGITYGFAACEDGDLARILIQDGYTPVVDAQTIGGSMTDDIVSVWSVKSGSVFYTIAVTGNHKVQYTADYSASGGATWNAISTYIAGGVKDLRFVLDGGNLKGYFLANGGKLYPFTLNTSNETISLGASLSDRYSSIALSEGTDLVAYDYIDNELETIVISTASTTTTDLSSHLTISQETMVEGALSGAVVLIQKDGTILNLTSGVNDQTYNVRPLPINDMVYDDNAWVAVTDNGKLVDYSDTLGVYLSYAGADLNGASYSDSTGVIAVGDSGTIFSYDNDMFTDLDAGTNVDLLSVCVNDSGSVLVGGAEGFQAFTNHFEESFEELNAGVFADLTVAHIDDSMNTVAAGNGATFVAGASSFATEIKRVTPADLVRVDFHDAEVGGVIGADFCVRLTNDGGRTFSTVQSADDFTTDCPTLYGLEVHPGKAYVTGDNIYLATIENNWANEQTLTGTTNVELRDISIIGDVGYIVGGKTSDGRYYKSSDGGSTWSTQYDPSGSMKFFAMHHFENNNQFIAVAEDGDVMQFNGTTASQLDVNTAYDLMDIAFFDNSVGYVVDQVGNVFKATNVSWNNPQDRVITGIDWSFKPQNNFFDGQTQGNGFRTYAVCVSEKNTLYVGGDYVSEDEGFFRLINDESDEFSTQFYYDKLGRIVVSQNSRQKNEYPEKFSYTLYDELGRVVEAGEKTENDAEPYLSFNNDAIQATKNTRGLTTTATMETWIRTTDDTTHRWIVCKKEDGSSSDNTMALSVLDGKIRLWMNDETNDHYLDGSEYIADGEWHHVVGIIDSTRLSIYIDGALDTNMTASGYSTQLGKAGNTYTLYLGYRYTYLNNKFVGDMKDFRLWKDVRSAQEIQEYANKELDGDEDDLVAYFDMNEGSGTVLKDKARIKDASLFDPPTWVVPERLAFNDVFGSMVSDYYNPNVIDDEKLLSWINDTTGARKEVTHSYYDTIVADFNLPISQNEDNLRKRIGSVTFEEEYDADDATYDYATHYDYDIHGNVKTLIQDNKKIGENSNADIAVMQFKRVDYDYDLISGNVHQVSYQKDSADQWYHKYEYDADNRIQTVSTSSNGFNWEEDVRYFYYDHGPLARVELGENNVQGIDYAYTLQGWLKGVNSDLLTAGNDIGKDGSDTLADNPNQYIARDAFGFSLNYFSGDYSPISSDFVGSSAFNSSISGSDVANNRHDLYNGNIGAMVTTIKQPRLYSAINPMEPTVHPQATAYYYDQLNRLLEARAFVNVDSDAASNDFNSWENSGSYDDRYYNSFIYDANGNIETQLRKDVSGSTIDSLIYRYALDGNDEKVQNRLYCVNDIYDYDDADIDDMGTFVNALAEVNDGGNNYKYDATGQLIQDTQEEIASIEWRVDGKIKAIVRSESSVKKNLVFDYDPMGNRIAKHIYSNASAPFNYTSPTDWEKTVYYNRDAQGNVLAVYEYQVDTAAQESHFTLVERNIYGSSRVGMNVDTVEMIAATGITDHYYGMVGKKQYELSNHLGNVLSVVTDKKYALDHDYDDTIDYYQPDVLLTYDYSPFGVLLPERSFDRTNIITESITPDYNWTFDSLSLDETYGSSHSVTLYNTPSGDTSYCDKADSAYLFDGVNQYGEVSDHADLDFGAEDFTIAAWVQKKSHMKFGNTVVSKWKTGGLPGENEWSLSITSGTWGTGASGFTIEDTNEVRYTVLGSTVPSLDQWYHLVGMRDGDSIKVFLDGALEGSLYVGSAIVNNADIDMMISGIYGGNQPRYMDGIVDDIKIYHRALSEEEVDHLYNSGSCDYVPLAFGSDDQYRWQFQGQERDDEVKGAGNSINFKYRMHDPRLGRFFAVDPLTVKYPYNSPYAFSENRVVDGIELEGAEIILGGMLYYNLKSFGLIDDDDVDEVLGVHLRRTLQWYSGDVVREMVYGQAEYAFTDPRSFATERMYAVLTLGYYDIVKMGMGYVETVEDAVEGDAAAQVDAVMIPVTIFAPVKAESAAGSEVAASESPTAAVEGTSTLYRGVNKNHVAYSEALKGTAKPKGGTATPVEHNGGVTESPYTSWTTDPEVAINYATRPLGDGVVLKAEIPKSKMVESPNVEPIIQKQTGELISESEVLVEGTVTNAKVINISAAGASTNFAGAVLSVIKK
jgi:RHS repeat-associated protein